MQLKPKRRLMVLDEPLSVCGWIKDLDTALEPHRHAILNCPLLKEAEEGLLSRPRVHAWAREFYPLVENFPSWLALNIPKTTDADSRAFLMDNLRVERKHADQWIDLAMAFGIEREHLKDFEPIPEIEALNHFLWSVNYRGSLPEALAATSYAVEGIAHDLAVRGLKILELYDRLDQMKLSRRAYRWLVNHAHYDDLHPKEALAIIVAHATTPEVQRRCIRAARRSLEYLHLALTACYEKF